MLEALLQLGLFTAKAIIILVLILIIFIAFFALLAKAKQKQRGQLHIKNLNKKFQEIRETILAEVLQKKTFKQFLKEKKAEGKIKEKNEEPIKNIYVLNFHGDIKASAVSNLSEEVTAVLNVATPQDEVVVRVESPGGVVHGYGLAAAQLMRFRHHHIPLTVAVDKVAASGGYMMASVANKILAAPFAILGSIGVIVQLPNFNRLLKEKQIDFEQLTAGEFKRTITLFGENTEKGREKLQHEIEDIHQLFKNLIAENRPMLDIAQVATGEHWLGQQALKLKLVDEIKTSDEYLFERSKEANIYEIGFEIKKSLLSRLTSGANVVREKLSQFGL